MVADGGRGCGGVSCDAGSLTQSPASDTTGCRLEGGPSVKGGVAGCFLVEVGVVSGWAGEIT